MAEKHKHQDVFMAAKAAEKAVNLKMNHREKLNALKCENLEKEPLEKLAKNALRNVDHMNADQVRELSDKAEDALEDAKKLGEPAEDDLSVEAVARKAIDAL
jgi:hypothetical protein